MDMINNDNKTELSPIRSVIIWVSKKIGRPRSGQPRFYPGMITDRIERHEVLLQINQNYGKIWFDYTNFAPTKG